MTYRFGEDTVQPMKDKLSLILMIPFSHYKYPDFKDVNLEHNRDWGKYPKSHS